MFNSKGWQLFNEEVELILKGAIEYAPMDCPTNDNWQYRRGDIARLQWLKGYEDFTKACIAQLEEEGYASEL